MSTEQPVPTLENLASSPYTYDHVPTLKELLPTTGGLPGVKYIQLCTTNAKAGQDGGWGPVENAKIFTITGPKGSSDILLACKGTPIRGASTQEGARTMSLDEDIYKLTGLWLGLYPESLQQEFNIDEYGKATGMDKETNVAVTSSPKQSNIVMPSAPAKPASLEDAMSEVS